MKKQLLLTLGLAAATSLSAQKNFWTQVQNVNLTAKTSLAERKSMPTSYKLFNLNVEGLKSELSKAPERFSNNEILVLKFPDAKGKLRDYVVKEASVLSPELAAKYPGINSYVGYEKGKSENSIRFSINPYTGISVMYFDGWEVSYLDSYTTDNSNYIVYERKNLPQGLDRFNCLVDENDGISLKETQEPSLIVQDGRFRTYRLAIACTIEYAAFHVNRAGLASGTLEQKKAAVLAAMATTMTRVNGVYEKTLSLTMVLVPNNDQIVYIDSDNFSNNSPSTLINESQTVIDTVIGSANYDIGHTFSTGGGGLAQLRSPCGLSKARGITGTNSPVNDPYDIDYVAHEMGHQFGGNHTFRAGTGSCSGNANTPTAVEPGSGSTIMAYAGICGTNNNVQNNSDPYFHTISVNEMYSFISRPADCSAKVSNNNGAPTANAGPDYTIPFGTAFALTGTGTDPDGDALTYLWEQTDVAAITNNPQPPTATTTMGTVFRSYLPTTSNIRYFPRMTNILLNNVTPKWEVIPSVARTLNFSLLVNDNKATGNQTSRDNVVITVANAGPFKVTSHTSNVEYTGGEPTTITWDVAGTNAAPINTQNVQILLSTDNGATFSTILADSVPNNGSATVILPNQTVAGARIMIKAVDNIYFAVNSSFFTIKENLAVNESAFEKGFSVYPNPAKGEVYVSLSKVSNNATYQILDLSGRIISNGQLESTKTKINISNLKSGNYRILISNNGETTSKNLIVK